jgi:hypothetical protein
MRYGKHSYTWQHWLQGTRTTETLESEFRSSAASPGAEATWRTLMTNCLSPAIRARSAEAGRTYSCTLYRSATSRFENKSHRGNRHSSPLCPPPYHKHSMADTDYTDWFRGFSQSLRAHGTADDTVTRVPSSRSTVLAHWSANERRTFLRNKTGQ